MLSTALRSCKHDKLDLLSGVAWQYFNVSRLHIAVELHWNMLLRRRTNGISDVRLRIHVLRSDYAVHKWFNPDIHVDCPDINTARSKVDFDSISWTVWGWKWSRTTDGQRTNTSINALYRLSIQHRNLVLPQYRYCNNFLRCFKHLDWMPLCIYLRPN